MSGNVQRELAAVDELAAELYANGVGYSPILARALLAPAGVIARLIADAEKRAAAQALRDAADAARGMDDPPSPDCVEWADWLDARADALDPT